MKHAEFVNKLTFIVPDEKVEGLLQHLCPKNIFDFSTLMPAPIHIYRGSMLEEYDDDDFPMNIHRWRLENYGCRDAAHKVVVKTEDNLIYWPGGRRAPCATASHVHIMFATDGGIPMPIIVAIANIYDYPFTHKYISKDGNIFGIDWWERGIRIISKKMGDINDKVLIYSELMHRL